jgi:hypothetical protein
MTDDSLQQMRDLLCRCFPTALPDETLFSMFSRFDALLGTGNDRVVGALLVGREQAVQRCTSISNLRLLGSLLPQQFPNVNTIIYSHTLGGLYLRFMKRQAFELAVESVLGPRRPRRLHAYRWMTKAFERVHPLRYCPECLCSDGGHHGSAYWRLQHQAPLVHTCVLHHCPLRDVIRPKAQWTLPDHSLAGTTYSTTEFHLQYGAVMPLLFGSWQFDILDGKRNVARLLEDAGVVSAARKISAHRVRSFVRHHVPEVFLEQAQAVTLCHTENWLEGLLRGDGNPHPVWWCVLLTCLAREGIPRHLIEEVAQGVRQRSLPGFPPPRLPAPYRVCEVLETGVSAVECARMLQVSPGVVSRWLRDSALRSRWLVARTERMRAEYRAKALKVKARFMSAPRHCLLSFCMDSVQWLQRHDREWLDEHFPVTRPRYQRAFPFMDRVRRAPPQAYELLATGAAVVQVAQATCLPVSRVLRWLRGKRPAMAS